MRTPRCTLGPRYGCIVATSFAQPKEDTVSDAPHQTLTVLVEAGYLGVVCHESRVLSIADAPRVRLPQG